MCPSSNCSPRYTLGNCNITAAKPTNQFQNDPMPTNEVQKMVWLERIVDANKLDKRVYGLRIHNLRS